METATVTIQDVAFGGNGVGRLPEGKVVFVPGTLTGEIASVFPHRSRSGYSEAELVKVLQPSPHRVAPPCPYFGPCGGCQYQHASYEEQLRIKEKQVRDTLQRIGGFRELPPLHMEAAPSPHGYRNKITVHSGSGGELGFFARDNRTVIDVERCLIANDAVNAQLAELRRGSFRPRHASLVDSSQRAASPEGSFHQVNTAMAARLLEWIRGRLDPAPLTQLLDLYCGAGFFTLELADRFAGVCGVDRDPQAIHAATVNAQKRGIRQARFFAGDVANQVAWHLNDAALETGTVLVDPPREGLPPEVTQALAAKTLARLIYVSCNPSTLARDLKRLAGGRLTLRALGVFDMFPQTAHIETVAVLQNSPPP